jgi:hypothetical protein
MPLKSRQEKHNMPPIGNGLWPWKKAAINGHEAGPSSGCRNRGPLPLLRIVNNASIRATSRLHMHGGSPRAPGDEEASVMARHQTPRWIAPQRVTGSCVARAMEMAVTIKRSNDCGLSSYWICSMTPLTAHIKGVGHVPQEGTRCAAPCRLPRLLRVATGLGSMDPTLKDP